MKKSSRYLEIQGCLDKLPSYSTIVELLPVPKYVAALKLLGEKWEKLRSVTIALQRENLDFLDACLLFDEILNVNNEPEFAKYLNPNDHLVHKPHFESAVRKILLGEEATLKYEETESVKALQASQKWLMATVPDNDVDDFATICLQNTRKPARAASIYLPTSFYQHLIE